MSGLQFVVFLVAHGFEPFVAHAFARGFECDVAEPAVPHPSWHDLTAVDLFIREI